MTTLYIREVPEGVAETLKDRAASQGMSLSAFVNAELALIASRPTNADIVERLRGRERVEGVSTEDILSEVRAARR